MVSTGNSNVRHPKKKPLETRWLDHASSVKDRRLWQEDLLLHKVSLGGLGASAAR
jgi:hypothetical protein